MTDNPKNKLQEYMQLLGCFPDTITFHSLSPLLGSLSHRSSVRIQFPDGRQVVAEGEGTRKVQAELAAASNALSELRRHHPDLLIDWEEIKVEAQGGDALIKLGVYISDDLPKAEAKSRFLQIFESDAHLTKLFDTWKEHGDPDLGIWGPNLGEKRKATLVEALIWRRFKEKVLDSNARSHLQVLLATLENT